MNKDQAVAAAQRIDRELLEPNCDVAVRDTDGTSFPHLRWMVQEMSKPDFSENKAMRWLGYLQGVLVACGDASLEDMKRVSAAAVGVEI